MRAIQIQRWGGPEVLELVDVPAPEPGPGEALVRVARAGINFADTHTRENSYLASNELPYLPGAEVAGTVERGSDGLPEGARVVALCGSGGYAELVAVRADRLIPIPDGVSDAAALALVVPGLTAWHLYATVGRVAPGESVVVHAAAGGVGSIAVQLGRRFGATVIATASSEDKRALALRLGAAAAVDATREDLGAALREANGGRKVDVVFEMAGGRMFEESLAVLAPFGRLVTYGMASREPNSVQTGVLMRRSQAVVGFWLMHCLGRPEMVAGPLGELFGMLARGQLEVVEGPTFGLSEARRAHEELQARRTAGKLVLDPAR